MVVIVLSTLQIYRRFKPRLACYNQSSGPLSPCLVALSGATADAGLRVVLAALQHISALVTSHTSRIRTMCPSTLLDVPAYDAEISRFLLGSAHSGAAPARAPCSSRGRSLSMLQQVPHGPSTDRARHATGPNRHDLHCRRGVLCSWPTDFVVILIFYSLCAHSNSLFN
jgi:hypothetical protein